MKTAATKRSLAQGAAKKKQARKMPAATPAAAAPQSTAASQSRAGFALGDIRKLEQAKQQATRAASTIDSMIQRYGPTQSS